MYRLRPFGEIEPEADCDVNGRRDPCRPFRQDLEIDLFRDRQRVVDLNTQVPDCALKLGVAEQQLDGSQVACLPDLELRTGTAYLFPGG